MLCFDEWMRSLALDVEPPAPITFDETLRLWKVSRYADVASALHDSRLVAGESGTEWHSTYRKSAIESLAGETINSWLPDMERYARFLLDRTSVLDIVEEFAKPFCRMAAERVCDLSGPDAIADAEAIFASAADPFNTSLRERSYEATRRLVAGSTPLGVQTFVAMTQSVPAFLANSLYAMWTHNARGITSAAIEELLRYAGPAKAQLRTAVETVNLGGIYIAKRERVALMLASANRDADAFLSPNDLDFERSPNKHFAFGSGTHSCLGASLVRSLSAVALRVLLEGFPELHIQSWRSRDRFAMRAIDSLQASPSTTPHRDPH
jgi:cytochrome P450